jgi:hypothetical protein
MMRVGDLVRWVGLDDPGEGATALGVVIRDVPDEGFDVASVEVYFMDGCLEEQFINDLEVISECR